LKSINSALRARCRKQCPHAHKGGPASGSSYVNCAAWLARWEEAAAAGVWREGVAVVDVSYEVAGDAISMRSTLSGVPGSPTPARSSGRILMGVGDGRNGDGATRLLSSGDGDDRGVLRVPISSSSGCSALRSMCNPAPAPLLAPPALKPTLARPTAPSPAPPYCRRDAFTCVKEQHGEWAMASVSRCMGETLRFDWCCAAESGVRGCARGPRRSGVLARVQTGAHVSPQSKVRFRPERKVCAERRTRSHGSWLPKRTK
jgi:hypothetical protein